MAVHLITGFKGEEHIQSADQGSFNASFFGDGEFVMEAGNQCEASILDNNTVRVLDGDILMQGRHIRIPSNTYIDVNIKTGTAGVNRNDLIVMEYSKDANSGIETADLKVIQGVASEGTATDPSVATGDILGGATLNQMPLYRVKVEGVVLTAIESLFTTIPTYKKLAEQYAEEFQEACETHLNSLNILDSKEEIEANTQENQLAGALALKEVIASLGDAATIIYNPETDMIQILGSDGIWYDYGRGGLLWDGSLYRDGNTYSDTTGSFSLYQVAGSGGGTYSLTFNTNNITLTSTSSLGILSTNNKIDFSKYTKLHIEGTLTHTDGDNVGFTVGFSTSKNATDTSVYSFEIGKTTRTISETIDISTHNSSPLYVHIKFYARFNYKWVGNFVLNNLYFLP